MTTEYRFQFDRAGNAAPLRAVLTVAGPHGAQGAAGAGAARGLPRGTIDAAGQLRNAAGTGPYLAASPRAGTDPAAHEHILTVMQGMAPLATFRFFPVAVAGVVDVNERLRAGQGLAVTGEQMAALSELLTETAGAAARVDQVLADTAQQQELNNAATAANLGRRTSPSVAAIGAEPGLYNITSGPDAGQVWERPAGGGAPVRRETLEAASAPQLTAQTQRLQFTTLADLQAATGLSAGQTVIVQDGLRGGTFVVGAAGTLDGVLTYALPGRLYAHRVWDGTTLQATWAGVGPASTAAANSDGVEACILLAGIVGARVLQLPAGSLPWARKIHIRENLWIRGAGMRLTTFTSSADVGLFFLDPRPGGGAYSGVRISDLGMRREVFPTRVWELDLPDCVNPIVEDVLLDTYHHVSDRSAVSGIRMQNSAYAAMMAQIHRCHLTAGSIWMELTDSRITGCYIWAHLREYGVRIRNTANVSISDTDIVPSPVYGGVWGNNSFGITIDDDVRYDGSYAGVSSGWGANIEGGHSHNLGGDYYQLLYGSVRLAGVTNSVIRPSTHREGNRVNDPDYNGPAVPGMDQAYPDILLENASRNTVHVGSHRITTGRNRAGGGGPGNVVRETGTSNGNVITGGSVTGTYSGPYVVRAGADTIVRAVVNDAGQDVTRRAVTVQWANGSGTVGAAPHGLGVVPRTVHYPVPQAGNLGAARILWAFADAQNVYVELTAEPATAAPSFKVLVEL